MATINKAPMMFKFGRLVISWLPEVKKMVKCQHSKPGDACHGKEFKNQQALNMHVFHRHKGKEESNDNTPEEPTKDDLIDQPTEIKKEEGVCSDCMTPVKSGTANCPNCGVSFGGDDGDQD